MQGSNSEMHERFARKEKNTGGKQVHKAEKNRRDKRRKRHDS